MILTITSANTFTYLFNILIQSYAFLSSYPSMAVILPFIVRFRTVIDYRLTHEYFHLHERAERHSYFQALLTVSLNAYFATILVSILLGQPVSLLLTSTPLFITWIVYTMLWFIPIKLLHTISRYFRWFPSLAGIVFECLLCIFTIERAMRVSYESQPTAVPVSSLGNPLDDITPTELLRIPSAISTPFAILCGFLIVQGNALLGEMINIHGNFRIKTPSQIKNPFTGNGKIALIMALMFVSFVTIFVPAHIFLKGAKNAPANLLPIIQVTHNNFNGAIDTEEFCISQQNRISQVCYQDWMLSWCPDHTPANSENENNIWNNNDTINMINQWIDNTPLQSFRALSNEIICDFTLSVIHILGLKDCDLEQHLPSVPALIAKQHETHSSASKAITTRLHYNILADSQDLHALAAKRSAKNRKKHGDLNNQSNDILPPKQQPFAHIYPTIPIDQVGQPFLARVLRETIGSRIDFYRRGVRGVMKTIGYGIRQVAHAVGSAIEQLLPVDFISHLHPQPHFQCVPLSQLSSQPINFDTNTHGGNSSQPQEEQQQQQQQKSQTHQIPMLLPGPNRDFHNIIQSAVPPDVLFFVHVPTAQLDGIKTDGQLTNIYPITFTLVKSFVLLTWFVVHFYWLFVNTKFQSKYASKLDQIWYPSPEVLAVRTPKGNKQKTPIILKTTPFVTIANDNNNNTMTNRPPLSTKAKSKPILPTTPIVVEENHKTQ